MKHTFRTGEQPDGSPTAPASDARSAGVAGWVRWSSLMLCCLVGCSGISVGPACPAELDVGESGPVAANEIEPGHIPTYLWEVFPPGSGTFVDPSAPSTTFQALLEGEALIRLTASDGLYQVVSECRTQVSGSLELIVSLEASPNPVSVGGTVTLTCISSGVIEATILSILQVDGLVVELIDDLEGVATFEADQPGNRIFQCTGEDENGVLSHSILATVYVDLSPDGTGNANDNTAPDNTNGNEDGNENDNAQPQENGNENGPVNDNANANDNAGDNQNENENDNTGDNDNDNTQGNANDNEGDNKNDNGGRIPSRPPA